MEQAAERLCAGDKPFLTARPSVVAAEKTSNVCHAVQESNKRTDMALRLGALSPEVLPHVELQGHTSWNPPAALPAQPALQAGPHALDLVRVMVPMMLDLLCVVHHTSRTVVVPK